VQAWSSIFAIVRALALGLLLGALFTAKSNAQPSEADWGLYHLAVEYCRGPLPRPIASGPDRRIVCFDGWIDDGMDLSAVSDLQDNGLFVVRSFGGDRATAIALAQLLQDHHATVVVYDYCLAACASFLLIASDHAYVTSSSIVAWRVLDDRRTECIAVGESNDRRGKRLRRTSCPEASREQERKVDTAIRLEREFYAQRTVVPNFEGPPDSTYTRRTIRNIYDQFGIYQRIAWTLNPRYHVFFKTKITYESYPGNQDEVDALAARYRLGKVICDP